MASVEISTVGERGTVPLLTLIGEFDLSNFKLVDDFIILWLAQGRTEAVLDMTRTRFVDAAVLESLGKARAAGLVLTIQGAKGVVRRALEAAEMGELIAD